MASKVFSSFQIGEFACSEFWYLIDKAMQKGLKLLKAYNKEFRNVFFELIAKIMNLFGLGQVCYDEVGVGK